MPSVSYLNVEQVLFVHYQLTKETGGSGGIRDVESLAAAVLRPQTGIGEQEFFPDHFSKAAALLDSLIRRLPFVDGNKRTSMVAMGLFLQQNGWILDAQQLAFEDFAVHVAVFKPSIEEIAAWIRDNSKPHP